MKHFLTTSAAFSLSLIAFGAACSSADETPTPVTTDQDAGSQDSGPSDLSDADAADSSTDASQADASTGANVTITVRVNEKPANGTKVVFQSADGSVVDVLTTDAAGNVTHKADGIDMATIIGPATSRQLITVTGLKAGDDLSIPFYVVDDANPAPAFNVTLPVQAASDSYYAAIGSCGNGGGTSISFALAAQGCGFGRPTVPLLALSYMGGSLIASLSNPNVTPNSGGGATAVDLSGGSWSTNLEPVNVAFTGTQPDNLFWTFDLVKAGLAFHIANGDAPGTTNAPTGFADAYQAAWVANGTNTVRTVARRVATSQKTITTSATEFLTAITWGAPDTTIPTRPVFNWTSAGAGVDGQLINFSGTMGTDPVSWVFIVPPETVSWKVPAMPSDLPIQNLNLAQFIAADTDYVVNYDQFRKESAALINTGTSGTSTSVVVRTSMYFTDL